MATAVDERRRPAAEASTPRLVFFHSAQSGRCRRVEGFIAQVLQRRQNHDTFTLYHVAKEREPALFERFGIKNVPTLVVVEDKAVCGRLEVPRSCRAIEGFLAPWLK
jgi:thioredoxin-like negative regulator of GroEL